MAKLNINRDINYINKDFTEFRNQLINFSQTYFPNTYTDFSETSPGMMFMEQTAYVGDVLSFYLDNQIQENFLQYARQSNNIYDLAYMLGYTPKLTSPSVVELELTQELPAKSDGGGGTIPDWSYALTLKENSVFSSINGTNFIIEDFVDFSFSSSFNPTSRDGASTLPATLNDCAKGSFFGANLLLLLLLLNLSVVRFVVTFVVCNCLSSNVPTAS